MKSLQYPGIRYQQIGDPKTRDALRAFDGYVRALYDYLNSVLQTDHGQGFVRLDQPIVVPEEGEAPNLRSTYGVTGQLVRHDSSLFLKTGASGTDTDWDEVASGGPFATVAALAAEAAARAAADALLQPLDADLTQIAAVNNVRGDLLVTTLPAGVATWTRLAVGSSGTFLRSDGTDVAWAAIPATPPGGSAGDVQYNNGAGGFAGSAAFNWDGFSTLNFGEDGINAIVANRSSADSVAGSFSFQAGSSTSGISTGGTFYMIAGDGGDDPGSVGGDVFVEAGTITNDDTGSRGGQIDATAGDATGDAVPGHVWFGAGNDPVGGADGGNLRLFGAGVDISEAFNAGFGGDALVAAGGSAVGGDGGNLYLNAGLSSGGTAGSVRINANSSSLGLRFWSGAVAVLAQPTTAYAAATFAPNTSLIFNDSATWDGYTIGQVVKVLRDLGLLA